MNGFRTTSINDSITPTHEDILALATQVGLNTKEATGIFEEMRKMVLSLHN